MEASAPRQRVDIDATCDLAQTREINRLGDCAKDQRASIAGGLNRERPLQFEVAAGTYDQIGGKPQPRAIEGIIVAPAPGKTRRDFACQEKGGIRRTGQVGPCDAWHQRSSPHRLGVGLQRWNRGVGRILRATCASYSVDMTHRCSRSIQPASERWRPSRKPRGGASLNPSPVSVASSGILCSSRLWPAAGPSGRHANGPPSRWLQALCNSHRDKRACPWEERPEAGGSFYTSCPLRVSVAAASGLAQAYHPIGLCRPCGRRHAYLPNSGAVSAGAPPEAGRTTARKAWRNSAAVMSSWSPGSKARPSGIGSTCSAARTASKPASYRPSRTDSMAERI